MSGAIVATLLLAAASTCSSRQCVTLFTEEWRRLARLRAPPPGV